MRARVTGILEKRFYQEGAPVRAGQPLFVIDPKPLPGAGRGRRGRGRARAGAARAGRARGRAAEAAGRAPRGRAEGSRRRRLERRARARGAEGRRRRELAEVKLNLGYTRVNAPITGLSSRAHQVGGQPRHRQRHAADARSGRSTRSGCRSTSPRTTSCALNRAVAAGRLAAAEGQRVRRDGASSPTARRFRARAGSTSATRASTRRPAPTRCAPRSPNADGALKPGQFVRVQLKGAVRKNALAVPQVAVLDGPQGKFVYVAGKDKDGKDVARRAPGRRSATGSRPTARTCGSSSPGSRPGDTVIVDGIAELQPGAPIKLGGAGAPALPAPAPAPARPARRTARQARTPAQGARRAGRSPDRGHRPCSRASSSTGRSSRPCISMFLVLAGLAAMRSLPIAQYPEIAPPVVTVQAVYPGASRRGARADGRRAARERDQRRAGHDLHELALDGERRRADPGHVRDRHQRRRRGDQRQQPRQAGRAAAAAGSAAAGRHGRARHRRRSCRCWRSTRRTAATTTCSSRTT